MRLIILVVAFASTIAAVPIEEIEKDSSSVPDVIEKTTVKFEIEKVEDKSKFSEKSEKDIIDKKVDEISKNVEILKEKESIKKDVIETSTVRDFEEQPLTLYEEVKPEEVEDEEISLPNRIGTRIFIEKQQQQRQPPKKTGHQKIIICSPEKTKKKHGSHNDEQMDEEDYDDDVDDEDDENYESNKKSKKGNRNKNKNKNDDPAVIIRDDALFIKGDNPNIVKDERVHSLHRRPDIYYGDDYNRRPLLSQNQRPGDQNDDIYHDFDRRRPPAHLTPHDDYYYDDIRRRPPPSGYASDYKDNIRWNRRPPAPPASPTSPTTAAPQVVVAKRPLVVLRPTHRPPVKGNTNSTSEDDEDEVYELEHVYEVDDFRDISGTIPNINKLSENIPDEETRLIKVEKSQGPEIIMICEKKHKKSKEDKKKEKEEKKKEKEKQKQKEKEKEQKVVVVYPSKPTIHISKRKPHLFEARPVYIYQTYSGDERFPAEIVSNLPHELPILAPLTTDKVLYPPNPYLHIPSISVQAGITGNHPQSILQNVQENPSSSIIPHLSAHVLLHSPGTPNREHLSIPHIPHIPQFSYVQTQFGERRPDHLGISVLEDSIKPIISIGINKEVSLKEPEKKGEMERDHEKDMIEEVKDKKDFEMVKDGKVEEFKPMDSSIINSSEMKDVPMKKDEIIKEDMKEMMVDDGMVMSDSKIKDEDKDKKVINSQMSGSVHLPIIL